MGPEDCQVMNSKPSDPQQRRPDGRMYLVNNKEQSGSDDWHMANVVDWLRHRLGCSSRPGTAESVNTFKNRLDKYWHDQVVKFNWKSNIKGTRIRSNI